MTDNKKNCGCSGEHNHGDCGENCGCNHEHEDAYMYITLETGEELKCIVLGVFEVEGQEYIALGPEDGEDAFVYRYKEVNNEPILENIEDDEEYDVVANAFEELFNE